MLFYFVFFFVSGFCGILYELIWLRLAMAQFGVTTALFSIAIEQGTTSTLHSAAGDQ